MAAPIWPRKYYSITEKHIISALFDYDVDVTTYLASQPTYKESIYHDSYPCFELTDFPETEAKCNFRFEKNYIYRLLNDCGNRLDVI
jgi:hypothetical protein